MSRLPRTPFRSMVAVIIAIAGLICVLAPASALAAPATFRAAEGSTTLHKAWIGGDSMAAQITATLTARLRATGVAQVPSFCRSSTGLVRVDFFNWPVKARSLMQSVHPQAAFFMIGTNDGQPISASGHVYPVGSSGWKRIYRIRVAGVMKSMRTGGAERVYWIGMPIMRSAAFSKTMRIMNSIFRSEAARHAGVTFIDTWKLFSSSSGTYVSSWRASDGIHFNMSGVNRLVNALMKRVQQDW